MTPCCGLHAQTLELKLCWDSPRHVVAWRCLIWVVSGLVQMGLWWANGSCDGPGSSLTGYYLGFSPATASLSSSVDVQMGFCFHRTWHFSRILVPSVNIVNEYSALLLLKQIPVKKSLCQPGQPPRYPSRVFLISQLIHYVKKMWKWFSVSCQDTVIPNWKYWSENLKKTDMEQMFLLIFLWQLKM